MIRVVAYDLALASTGVCLPDGTTLTIETDPADPLEVRLQRIVHDAVRVPVLAGRIHLAVIEDLPRNARGAGSTGPVHGAVGLTLHEWGVPIVRVTPATIKKYALGVGSGKGTSKDAMGIAAMKRAGLDFSGRGDACDAWWAWAAAMDHYGHPVTTMPAAHRDALAKVAWPELGEAAA